MIQALQKERSTEADEPRILLDGISWQFYKSFAAEIGERPSLRLTYDQGRLEIMTISSRHDRLKRFLGRLVETLTEELNIAICSIGSTTEQRDDLKRGIESDEGYYIQNEKRVRRKPDLDFNHDPPPDLVLEIEVSRPAIQRLPIYAALKVPEVWVYDGEDLKFFVLGRGRKYKETTVSHCFPFLHAKDVLRFLRQWTTKDETTLVRSFRAWVRENILPTWKSAD